MFSIVAYTQHNVDSLFANVVFLSFFSFFLESWKKERKKERSECEKRDEKFVGTTIEESEI